MQILLSMSCCGLFVDTFSLLLYSACCRIHLSMTYSWFLMTHLVSMDLILTSSCECRCLLGRILFLHFRSKDRRVDSSNIVANSFIVWWCHFVSYWYIKCMLHSLTGLFEVWQLLSHCHIIGLYREGLFACNKIYSRGFNGQVGFVRFLAKKCRFRFLDECIVICMNVESSRKEWSQDTIWSQYFFVWPVKDCTVPFIPVDSPPEQLEGENHSRVQAHLCSPGRKTATKIEVGRLSTYCFLVDWIGHILRHQSLLLDIIEG